MSGDRSVRRWSGEAGLARWAKAVRRADRELFARTARRHDPVLDQVLPALSRAADNAVLEMAVAAGLALVGGRRWREAAIRGLIAVAVTSPTVNILAKLTVGRRRPTIDAVPLERRLHRVPVTTSFPSGHAASAAAFATAAGSAAPELAIPLTGLAAAVGWSRVWTGVHYPGDVAAGAALGASLAVVVGRVWRRATTRLRRR